MGKRRKKKSSRRNRGTGHASPTVSAAQLLRGAWYAFDQCGRLLEHAVILHDNGAYSSAVGLAMHAREEMGKAKILLAFRKQVEEEGKDISVDDVRDACSEHVEKQRKGQVSVVQRAEGQGRLAELLWARMKSKPQSPEYREAERELDKITKKQMNRTPEDRHVARRRAFYVDPNEAGTGWNRPVDITAEEAGRAVVDAANDYSNQRDRLQIEVVRGEDPRLAAALEAWADRPALPPPKWPAARNGPTRPQHPIYEDR